MAKAPPTEFARLEMFCDLVDEYDEIAEAFPVSNSITVGGPPRPPSDRWGRIVRAMVLRKFLLAKTDHMHLGKISSALRATGAESHSVAELADAIDTIVDGPFGFMVYGDPHGDHLRADQIIEQILYGGFMHGDYDKWVRTKNRSSLMVENPLWEFALTAETQVRGVRNAIRQLVDEGHISPPTSEVDTVS